MSTISAQHVLQIDMSDLTLANLVALEKDALTRYSRLIRSNDRTAEVVEFAREKWLEASEALRRYQDDEGA